LRRPRPGHCGSGGPVRCRLPAAPGGGTALAVATFLALLPLVGPFLGGLLAFLIFAAAAGGLGWFAVKKLRSDL
jgi:uncharacterized protein (DUF697 family)